MNNLNIYSGILRTSSAVIEKFIQPLSRVHGYQSALFLQCVCEKRSSFLKNEHRAPLPAVLTVKPRFQS
jgi:hypothetical protein